MLKKLEPAKVILDTSTYIAALLSETGGSAEIFERIIENKIHNFYTEEILNETTNVLSRPKFKLEKEKQQHFTHIIQEISYKILQLQEFKVTQCRDKKDDKFLSLAKQIEADYIITLDNDLLTIKKIENTKIITPGEFLNQHS